MLTIKVKNQFKKDLKKAEKNTRQDVFLLKQLIESHLVKTGSVPDHYKPHLLQGNWKPHMECHVQPDFILIWEVDLQSNTLILVRCGSHAELFG